MQRMRSSMRAAIGRQLKQSLKIFHSFIEYLWGYYGGFIGGVWGFGFIRGIGYGWFCMEMECLKVYILGD